MLLTFDGSHKTDLLNAMFTLKYTINSKYSLILRIVICTPLNEILLAATSKNYIRTRLLT